MTDRPRVLLVTGATGGGHVSLAEAVRDRLTPDVEVDIVDPLPAVAHRHYRLVSRHAMSVWAAEYLFLDGPRRAATAHRVWALLLHRSLSAVLTSRRYDLVVTTYSFLSYEVGRVLRRLPGPVPLAMLLTDPNSLHASWLAERATARTFAPTRETFALARAAGFRAADLELVGWPVRRQFWDAAPADRRATLAGLGLDQRMLTLFVQGGAEGSAGFARGVEAMMSAAPGRVQVLLAAGRHADLAERFRGVPHLRVVPYTRNIAGVMAAADIVVGKAGPNALLEATVLGKPFIATAYIPGQESDNMRFLTAHGLGWVALEARQQNALVADLVANPRRLGAMQQSIDRYRRWNQTAAAGIGPGLRALMPAGGRPTAVGGPR